MKLKTTMTRRRLLAGASLMLFGPTAAPRIGRAQQAQWVYKYANNLQETHPMNIRAREMAAAIKQDTNGRFDLQLFPSSQLGSDTDTLSQIRSGRPDPFHARSSRVDQRYGIRIPRLRHRVEGDGRRFGRLYPRANRQGQPDCHGQDLG